MMTALEATELSIKVWEWLYENPLKSKYAYPDFETIEDMACRCPMCEFRRQKDGGKYLFKCGTCPLVTPFKPHNDCASSGFYKWDDAETKGDSRKGSRWILKKLRKYRDDILAGKIDATTGDSICLT